MLGGFVIWCSLMLMLASSSVKAQRCFATAPNVFRIGVEETVGIWVSEANYPLSVGIYLMDFPDKTQTFASKELKIKNVQIRVISLNEKLLPSREPFTLEVKNPHQDLVKTVDITPPETGIAESDLQLSSSPIYGNWRIIVRYGYQNLVNSSINFQVKEYVLPTFSVKLDVPRTISESNKTISGMVTAKYVYGKPVLGTVILTYEVRFENGTTKATGSFAGNKLDEDTGSAAFKVDVEKEVKKLGIAWFPEDFEFVVRADVVEQSSGKRENSISYSVFTNSSYFISFSGSTLDFKPGFPYQMQVQVHHADGDVLEDKIQIMLEEAYALTTSLINRTLPNEGDLITTDKGGRVSYSIATNSSDSSLRFIIKTVAPGIPPDAQAYGILVVERYKSPDKETFVKISVSPKEIQVDRYFSTSVSLRPAGFVTNIYYMVVSRGTILIFDKVTSSEDGYPRDIQFLVTADMSPSARLVVFAVKNGNVIADSVRLGVQRKISYNNFTGLQLKLQNSAEYGYVAPGEARDLYIQGEPGSFVGIAGADEALLILNKGEPLTDKKLFTEMDSRDLGYGAGGGVSIHEVFSNAGLLLLSYPEIAKEVEDPIKVKDDENVEAPETDEGDTLRSIRHLFPETLFFKTIQIGGAGCERLTSAGDGCLYNFTVPHSITTWQVQAVGISKTTGIAIAEPLRIKVFKQVFLQMDLPYIAVQKEQIEVPVTVFNYGYSDLTAEVFMDPVAGVCMGSTDGKASKPQEVTIPAKSAKTVVFLVMPLRAEEYTLKVKGVISNKTYDAVAKILKVVPQGEEKVSYISGMLDPAGIKKQVKQQKGVTEIFQDRKHTIKVDFELPNDYIPGSEKCTVSVLGSILGQAVETTLSEATQDFIRLPTGCGEQAMVHMAPLVYTMMYLNHSKQMTPQTKNKGYRLMEKGFRHQLKFRKTDGSFAVFTNRMSSTWLTAFVARVFCQANSFIKLSQATACDALKWLLTCQSETGDFYEKYKVLDKKIPGAVADNVTLTAFVLTTLEECNQCNMKDIEVAKTSAKIFLEDHVAKLQRPFDIALTSYALKLSNSKKALNAYNKLRALQNFNSEANTRYWNGTASGFSQDQLPWVYRERPDAVAVETTAYALLTSLLYKNMLYSHPIANWLNQQRSGKGSFASTQDTVVALQALAEYTSKAVPNVPDMTCTVSSQGQTPHSRTIYINKDNALQIQEIEIPGHEAVDVTTEGIGLASLSVTVNYHVAPGSKEKCKFEVNLSFSERNETFHYENPVSYNMVQLEIEDSPDVVMFSITDEDDAHEIMDLEICVRFLEMVPAEMSILDVGLFTGYKPILDELRNLTVHRHLTKVSYYEVTDRSVILYLDTVPVDQPLCVNVKAIRIIKVGLVQPAAVKIYDYYHPDKKCTKFYQPDGESSMLKTICRGDQCICVNN